jgi:hypothetical protein
MSSSTLPPLDRFEAALSRARVLQLPIGLGYLLAVAGSLFLWSLIGAAVWQLIG